VPLDGAPISSLILAAALLSISLNPGALAAARRWQRPRPGAGA
jgi:hypothetical protein